MQSATDSRFGPFDFVRFLAGTSMATMVGLIFLQEAFGAGTTWLVIQIARDITEEELHVGSFVWIVVAQTLSYLAGAASWIYAERAGFGAFGHYMLHFSRQNRFQTSLLTEADAREKTEPFLTSETFRVCFDLTYDLQFYLRLLFNLFLNAIVIGMEIDVSLPFAFGLAFVILALLQWLLRKPLAATYLHNQQMTNRMTARTFNAWDNIFTGNRYNFAIWHRDFRQRLDNALVAQIRAILAREGWSAISGLIALVIVLVATIWVIGADYGDTALLIAIAATLPRQIEMTTDMHQLTAGFTDLVAHWARIKGVCEHLRPLPDPGFPQRIKLERITLRDGEVDKQFPSLAEAVRHVLAKPTGLLSVRGGNGSGKSTLLIALKESLRGGAYYWPSHDRLSFDFNTTALAAIPVVAADDEEEEEDGEAKEAEEISAEELEQERKGYSSGERQVKVLREIAAKTHARVYLLDEWDANLDAANRTAARAIVDELARRALVVEISHRDRERT
jgi:ABC-type bacteriocin/lantibiotic exporter with double-glycine peptidase domain